MSCWMAFKLISISSRFRNSSGYVFFKICSLIFHDFWSQIGVVILVTPKQEVERKSVWLCGLKFFRSNFKLEWEYCVGTKFRFLASDFCSHVVILLWLFTVLQYFGSDFFLNDFPNPFIVHFLTWIFWTKFLANGFLFTFLPWFSVSF